MKDTVYLTINRSGVNGMRKTPPTLRAGEYAVRLIVTVNDKYFVQAIPTARLEIGEEFLIAADIDVEVARPEIGREAPNGPLAPRTATETTTVTNEGESAT